MVDTLHFGLPDVVEVKGSKDGSEEDEEDEGADDRRVLQSEIVFLVEELELVVFEAPPVEDPRKGNFSVRVHRLH